MEIKHYKTDTNNRNEGNDLNLKETAYDSSMSFIDILKIVYDMKANIIIKATYISEERSGKWYIKYNPDITYEMIKNKCEQNQQNNQWSSRDCYLIKYLNC